ncbi:MAG: tRNA lysidine(34) synthetase TilS [Lentimicrobiaceae bacterium]|nr:tRNA lysidine(34) synthetase TilS [Lentimicrobiaceae bacterium]
MLSKFISFINNRQLFMPHQNILLTVSGGMDSIAMAELFSRAGFRFAIAHCNFQLRGKDSFEDEKFVASCAQKYQVPLFSKRFETLDYLKERKISVQMAARELRYAWFEEIRQSQNFDYIATAHHADDATETFFINLMRGTGISGLHGILPQKDALIRPMLCFTRGEIEKFITQNHLHYRIDISNTEDKYLRNKIRHHLIPVFETLKPGALEGVQQTMQNLREVEAVYDDWLYQQKKNLLKTEGEWITIDCNALRQTPHNSLVLYELLSDFRFSRDVVRQIENSIEGTPGRQFFSPSHRLVTSSQKIIIEKYTAPRTQNSEFLVTNDTTEIVEPLHLVFSIISPTDFRTLAKSNNDAFFDLQKLCFPLIIRKWQKGDYFHPFGMWGKQKLSDFMVNRKFSLPEKENCWLLTSDKQIIWVIGYRTDERFKITNDTNNILHIRKL